MVAGGESGRWRRRGRRENVDGPRGRELKIRLTDYEDAALRAMAEARGVTRQRVLMDAALTGSPTSSRADLMDAVDGLERAVLAVARVGVNVNQIAKVANSTGEIESVRELSAVLAFAQRVIFQLEEQAGVVTREAMR